MIDIEKYGFSPEMVPIGIDGEPARVTAVHKERCEIICSQGLSFARLKSSVYYNNCTEEFPTTGDFVLIQYNETGDSQIIRTLPRSTIFSRRDPTSGGGGQAVAANFDYVFIMQSLNRDFNEKRLERYLTLAWQSGAMPVVILTKADLIDDYSAELSAAEQIATGVDVIAVSAVTGFGLDRLNEYLKPGKTLVFLGSSGVGKSSLVNALAGEEIMTVNAIRKDDDRGRHTTTHRQLIMLPCGTMIIDTPGMRELGLFDAEGGVGIMFHDINALLGTCRFTDCGHSNEPGCAVLVAIASGELSEERWEEYKKSLREAQYADSRATILQRKQERENIRAGFSKRKSKGAAINKPSDHDEIWSEIKC